MTVSDYLTAMLFISSGVQTWDDWVEDDSGVVGYVRHKHQQEQMMSIG